MSLSRVVLFLAGGLVLLAVAITAYAAHVNSSAEVLIGAAKGIRSTSDAEEKLEALRTRSGWSLWQEKSTAPGEQTYDIHIDNGLLHRLRIVPPTTAGITISIHNGKLRSIGLTMFSGRDPSTTSGVLVQEWFASDTASSFHLNDNGRPWKATVDIPSTAPQAQRDKAFAFNPKCLVRPSGCKSAEDILPNVWQLGGSGN